MNLNEQARLQMMGKKKTDLATQAASLPKRQEQETAVFPVFFKYFRMNEINMNITYFHEKSSFLNSKDLQIKLSPFISHYQFMPFQAMFVNYEKHCRKSFINQIPNILTQRFLKVQSKVDELQKVEFGKQLMKGVGSVAKRGQTLVMGESKKRKKVRVKKEAEDGEDSEYTDQSVTDDE